MKPTIDTKPRLGEQQLVPTYFWKIPEFRLALLEDRAKMNIEQGRGAIIRRR